MLDPGTRRESRAATEYAFGYPRGALRVVAGELVGRMIAAALLVIGPAVTAVYLLASPWRLAIPWHLAGLPLGVLLAALACWTAWGIAVDVRERFGLRVVPQFERRLEPGPGTYFSGRRVAAQVQRLDATAAACGVRTLSHTGFGRRGDSRREWFDAGQGSATIAALLAEVEPSSALHHELATWHAALRRAEAASVRFRLVIVSGTGMNAALWNTLEEEGF